MALEKFAQVCLNVAIILLYIKYVRKNWSHISHLIFFRCLYWLLWQWGSLCERFNRAAILQVYWQFYWQTLHWKVWICLYSWRHCRSSNIYYSDSPLSLDDMCEVWYDLSYYLYRLYFTWCNINSISFHKLYFSVTPNTPGITKNMQLFIFAILFFSGLLERKNQRRFFLQLQSKMDLRSISIMVLQLLMQNPLLHHIILLMLIIMMMRRMDGKCPTFTMRHTWKVTHIQSVNIFCFYYVKMCWNLM